jgi:hypothetical protein
MTPDSINHPPLPGSCIRVVYSIDGLEMFAMGVLVHCARDHITMEQYADQYGPLHPFRLTVQWSNVIRLTLNTPAASNRPAGAWGA